MSRKERITFFYYSRVSKIFQIYLRKKNNWLKVSAKVKNSFSRESSLKIYRTGNDVFSLIFVHEISSIISRLSAVFEKFPNSIFSKTKASTNFILSFFFARRIATPTRETPCAHRRINKEREKVSQGHVWLFRSQYGELLGREAVPSFRIRRRNTRLCWNEIFQVYRRVGWTRREKNIRATRRCIETKFPKFRSMRETSLAHVIREIKGKHFIVNVSREFNSPESF